MLSAEKTEAACWDMNKRYFLALVSKRAAYFRPNVCRDLERAFTRAGAQLEIHHIKDGPGVAEAIARATAAGCCSFIAVGGDGTVGLAASHLYGRPHRLAIIPSGTANTMARLLGIPLTTSRAIKLAATSANERAVDAMDAGGQLHLLNVSAGISSILLDGMKDTQKVMTGMFSYVIGAVRASGRIVPYDYELTIDGRLYPVRAVEIHVTNTGVLGLPQYHIHDSSRLDDGKVEVLVLEKWSPQSITDTVLDVLLRRRKKAIRFIAEGSRITIGCAEQQSVQGDGDIIVDRMPVDITVRRQAINFIVP